MEHPPATRRASVEGGVAELAPCGCFACRAAPGKIETGGEAPSRRRWSTSDERREEVEEFGCKLARAERDPGNAVLDEGDSQRPKAQAGIGPTLGQRSSCD